MLVGGFGESPYLRKQLKDTFGSKGVEVVTVDESTKKAAAYVARCSESSRYLMVIYTERVLQSGTLNNWWSREQFDRHLASLSGGHSIPGILYTT